MIKFQQKKLDGVIGKTPVTLFVFKDDKKVLPEFKSVDTFLDSKLTMLLGTDDFEASGLATELMYGSHSSKEPRIVVVGLGDKKEFTREIWLHAVGCATIFWQKRKVSSFACVVPTSVKKTFGVKDTAVLLAKGVVVGSYEFNAYKPDKKLHATKIEEVYIANIESKEAKNWEKSIEEGNIIGEAINRMRNLGNLPPNLMTPTYLADHAVELGKKIKGLKVSVLEKADMQKLKMGGILGVNAGSEEPPKFIIMEWLNGKKNAAPIVFVGKGITFDSGGISLKPGDHMDEMKFDMLGAAAVIQTLAAVAEMGLKANVIGLAPTTENLPSGSAYRPGDILTGMGGKTIEILNTDAEGRVILSDALEYAKLYKPAAVVDLATLTGACWRALGEEYAGLFTVNTKLKKVIEDAGEESSEAVWQLPLHPVHTKNIKSEVADVKNLGGPLAGASTAAAFLKEFTDYPWAHLDIAGVMAYEKGTSFQRPGARGWGVHICVETVKKFFKI